MKKRIAFICALFCALPYVTLCQGDDEQKKSNNTQPKLEKFRNEVALLRKLKKDLENECKLLAHNMYWHQRRNCPQSTDRYASLFPSGS